MPFFRKAKIIPPAVTGATESGADIEDTAESASLQAADDENGIFPRRFPKRQYKTNRLLLRKQKAD